MRAGQRIYGHRPRVDDFSAELRRRGERELVLGGLMISRRLAAHSAELKAVIDDPVELPSTLQVGEGVIVLEGMPLAQLAELQESWNKSLPTCRVSNLNCGRSMPLFASARDDSQTPRPHAPPALSQQDTFNRYQHKR